MTVSEIVTETVSMVKGIPEEDFTEGKLTDKLRTFAKENNLKFPKLMKLMRTVISGLKVSKVKLALVCYRYLIFFGHRSVLIISVENIKRVRSVQTERWRK